MRFQDNMISAWTSCATGFDSEDTSSHRGLGLLSMRERLRLVNGTISFTRIEPTGTRITVRVPVPDSD